MAVVTREVLIEVPVEAFYAVVVDYEAYPEFVPGVRQCRVTRDGPEKHVEYEVDLGVKKVRYVLAHREEKPRKVTWSLVGGELMKVSNGSWELTPKDGYTHARYSVEVQIAKPALVPQAIIDKVSDEITKVQLPKTLEAFKLRAEGR